MLSSVEGDLKKRGYIWEGKRVSGFVKGEWGGGGSTMTHARSKKKDVSLSAAVVNRQNFQVCELPLWRHYLYPW